MSFSKASVATRILNGEQTSRIQKAYAHITDGRKMTNVYSNVNVRDRNQLQMLLAQEAFSEEMPG